jgi:hypothetical protein
MGPRADAFIAGPFLALPADEDREELAPCKGVGQAPSRACPRRSGIGETGLRPPKQ